MLISVSAASPDRDDAPLGQFVHNHEGRTCHRPHAVAAGTRFSGAAMLMALIGIRSLRRLDHGYLTGGACMGVCLYLAYSIQTYGLVHTTPGKNAFLAATYCVFVPFFWWLIHKRRPDRYNLAAALLCLCGMGVVSLQSDLRIGRGEGLTILSGVFYALHIIATASAARGRSPVLLSFVQFAVAAVLSWVTAPFAAPAPEEIPADVWLRLGYLCVMCTGLCFLLQTFGQKYTPPTTRRCCLRSRACSARCFPLRSITSIWSRA